MPKLSYSDWSPGLWLEDGRVYGVMLWSGLALLTIALLILMRTRWGQARPLSKCVGLSMFAHVLFFTFAYTTHWFEAPPTQPPTPGNPIRVRMLSQEPTPTVDAESAAPWAASDGMAPGDIQDLGDVPRPHVESPPPEEQQPLPTIAGEPSGEMLQEMFLEAVAETSPDSAAELPEPEVSRMDAAPPPLQDPLAAAPLEDAGDLASSEPPREQAPDLAPLAAPPPVDFAEPSPPLETLRAERLDVQRDQLSDAATPASLDETMVSELAEIARGPDQLPTPLASDPLRRTITEAPAVHPVGQSAAGEPMRLGDGQPLPSFYRARVGDRLATAIRYGGSPRTEEAVSQALQWLARQQAADGRWSAAVHGAGREDYVLGQARGGAGSQADTGITGLALLAFLAAGHTQLEGDYQQTVARGMHFLQRVQSANGDLCGQASPYARTYCHGMAFLALSEGLGMTGDAQLKSAVRRAAEYSVRSQHPSSGGWRYTPQSLGDTSQFGWQAMALRSAELAGTPITPSTRVLMERFLRSVASGPHAGLAAYRAGEAPSSAMTAEALASRTMLQLPTNEAQTREAVNYLLQQPPVRANNRLNLYGMYYGTVALFQQQGDAWTWWNRMMQDQLLPLQIETGPQAGSWSDETLWGGYGGRVYSTAMATLCLEVYYRYLPLYSESPARTARH